MIQPRRAVAGRRAMTLIEVLLVLALLVVLATLTWPALEPTLAAYQLRKGADLVRSEWNRARTLALTSGETVQFRFMPNGHRFCLEQLDEPALLPGEGRHWTGVSRAASRQESASLDEKITFIDGQVEEEEVATLGSPTPKAEGSWSAPIQFYPDGTASTARLTLKNQRDQQVEITLRGLTGVVTVGRVQASQE